MALIDSLLNLYRVDGQVRALRSRLTAAERYLTAQDKQLEVLNEQLEELRTRKKHLQATVGNLEAEMAGIDERIEKLRNELNNAVTNKQYNALLTELNTVKLERGKIEERVLTEMEQIENFDREATELAAQVEERKKVREVAEAQLREREADVGQRLSELQHEREQAAVGIPSDCLQLFDELADTHDGEVMAQIEEINRRHREYACGACNMHMPFNLISTLLNTGEELVRCPACGRILYMQEDMRGSLAKK